MTKEKIIEILEKYLQFVETKDSSINCIPDFDIESISDKIMHEICVENKLKIDRIILNHFNKCISTATNTSNLKLGK